MDTALVEAPPQSSPIEPARVRDYLSYSALSTYQSCPLRYYFHYVLGLPEETVAASLAFGSAIHAAIAYHFEQMLAGREVPDLDILMDVYRHAWRVYEGKTVLFGKKENRSSMDRLADRLLWTFLESDLAFPEGSILGIEEELRGELLPGLPDLVARVDLIVETKDAVVVTDFKTARRTWTPDDVILAAPQLLLYSELVHTLANGKPVHLQFAVLTKTKSAALTLHPVPLDEHQLERTKRIAERVWQAIQGGHFYPAPSALTCPSCPFRKPCQVWTG